MLSCEVECGNTGLCRYGLEHIFLTIQTKHLIEGISPKRHTYSYSVVLEFFLCYINLTDSTPRITSIFA